MVAESLPATGGACCAVGSATETIAKVGASRGLASIPRRRVPPRMNRDFVSNTDRMNG